MESTPDSRLPLSALLSQVLVAFIIEFDNEFEHRMPHRTSRHGGSSGPWLVSMAMWSTCMRFVGGEGIAVRELEGLARTKTNLNGMVRWGYVTLADGVIKPTSKGRQAQEIWKPLFAEIEQRWEERFRTEEMRRLRDALQALDRGLDPGLPDCLPILGYGLFSRTREQKRHVIGREDSRVSLAALLSRVLLAFAIEFESESDISLSISANVIRVLKDERVLVRDLPRLSGVSKEGLAIAFGILRKKGLAVIELAVLEKDRRSRVATLTQAGLESQRAYDRLVAEIEERWQTRFGRDQTLALRRALEPFSGKLLFRALEPYPDNWRASVPKPETLPHYPMVLHRGGFPDGS